MNQSSRISASTLALNRMILISSLSAGWLGPALLSLTFFVVYLRNTLIPQVTGQGFLASYSAGGAAWWCLIVAAIWLAAAITYWAVYFLRGAVATNPDPAAAEPLRR
jgi:hypothetical protein